jgi:hypothetical protein
MDYQEYLKSDHWQKFRKIVLAFWDERCSICKSWLKVEVHHNNYRTLGHEQLSDVVCLCSLCHDLFTNNHRMTPREPQTFQTVIRKLEADYAAKHGLV